MAGLTRSTEQHYERPAVPASGVGDRPAFHERDPQAQLDQLRRDMLDAKVEIRSALETLVIKHGIPAIEINRAIQGYANDMLCDLEYEVKRELNREIEDRDPV